MNNIPILLLTFNRFETTHLVFESIRKTKPTKLYIAQDGPRNNNDEHNIQEVRKIFSVDRECDVYYLYREKNLGCLRAVTEAINRFFEHEEFGIILEDDCVMSSQFPDFCKRIDSLYRGDDRIGTISGSNYLCHTDRSEGDYFFSSHHPLLWGWATWRDRRKYYSNNIIHLNMVGQPFYLRWYSQLLYRDNNWYSILLSKNWYTVVPSVNLITNIGHIGIHSQRAGSFHDLPLGLFTDMSTIHKKNQLIINKKYDKGIKKFIFKLYFYTKIEILLKKLGLYKIVHTIFLAFIRFLQRLGIK